MKYRYYDVLTVGFAVVAVLSNVMAQKVSHVGDYAFGAAVVFFPISYIIGDLLTEVYGFKLARRTIWIGTGSLVFYALMSWVVVSLPPAADGRSQTMQVHYEAVLGLAPRIVLASVTAFFVGEYVNSITLSILKVRDQGRHFWRRALGSTVLGQAADSLIFYPVAFAGIWTWDTIIGVMLFNYAAKVGTEVVFFPVTYWFVNHMKRVEGVDVYDDGADRPTG